MAATLTLPKLPPPKLLPHTHSKLLPICLSSSKSRNGVTSKVSNDPQKLLKQTLTHLKSAPVPLTVVTLTFFLDPEDALGLGGQFGILEGRSFALVHPIVMSGLFLYTLYAGFLGWQWRRVRTIQEEINELKKQVKPVAVASDGNPITGSPTPSPVETKIQQLTEVQDPMGEGRIKYVHVWRVFALAILEQDKIKCVKDYENKEDRKELIKGSYRDKHFNAGSILLGFGVLESVFGGLNTWFRTGKLFPGPHLFAGAAITILWAAVAALVPPMQKGSETARNLHILLNTVNVLLFIWQIPTGIEIVFKVFEFTNWP